MVSLQQIMGNLKCNPSLKRTAPKKNSSSSIKLSDWVTSTTKIKVWWDQIIIDHNRKFGQVRSISDDRVQRRYDDLKAAPYVDYIRDILFYKVTRMCVVVFFSIVPFSRLNFRPCCYEYSCCTATRWVLLGGSACLHCCPKTQDRI